MSYSFPRSLFVLTPPPVSDVSVCCVGFSLDFLFISVETPDLFNGTTFHDVTITFHGLPVDSVFEFPVVPAWI